VRNFADNVQTTCPCLSIAISTLFTLCGEIVLSSQAAIALNMWLMVDPFTGSTQAATIGNKYEYLLNMLPHSTNSTLEEPALSFSSWYFRLKFLSPALIQAPWSLRLSQGKSLPPRLVGRWFLILRTENLRLYNPALLRINVRYLISQHISTFSLQQLVTQSQLHSKETDERITQGAD